MVWTPEIADILRTYATVYGEFPEIRDIGLLHSAIERPQAVVFGSEQYRSVDLKAAALLDSLCRNHSFVDGNKRCAWISVRLTYYRNLKEVWVAGDDAAYSLVMRASSEHMDVADIAKRLSSGFAPLK